MKKIKAFFKKSKLATVAVLALVFTAIASMTVFGSTFDLNGALGTAMEGVSTAVFGAMGAVIPPLLIIVGSIVALGFAISLIRRIRG